MNYKPQINSCNQGAWSPLLDGRSDLEGYPKAALRLENFFPTRYGAAEKSRGFEYLDTLAGMGRLKKFVFDDETPYLMVWGENTLTIYKNAAKLADLNAGTAGNQATLATPYTAAQARSLQFVQSFDVVWVMSGSHDVYVLTRYADNNWTLAAVYWKWPAVLEVNTLKPSTADITLTPSGTTGNITLTASQALFQAGHVGSYWVLNYLRNDTVQEGSFAAVTNTTSLATNVTATVSLTTTGTWEGTIVLESRATGSSDAWLVIGTFTRASSGQAAISVAVTAKDLRVRMTTQTSGTVNWSYQSGAVTGSFVLNTTRNLGRFRGSVKLTTHGIWTGNLRLEQSLDGTSYFPVDVISSENDTNTALNYTATERAYFRINIFNHTSGTVTWDFTSTESYNSGFVKITGYTSATVVSATVKSDLAQTTACDTWYEGAWSSVRGYPVSADFFGDRLYFLDNRGIHTSIVGDYENIERTGLDDGGIYLPLPSRDRQRGLWLIARRQPVIGTSGGIWVISSPESTAVITPSNIRADKTVDVSCGTLPALATEELLIYFQQGNRVMREAFYDISRDGLSSPDEDLTLLAEHLVRQGIVEMAVQNVIANTIWLLRSDGVLLRCLHQKTQQLTAFSTRITDGFIKSIEILPDGDTEALYAVVQRVVNGATVYYLERMQLEGTASRTVTLMQGSVSEPRGIDYLDSYKTTTGSGITTVTGLSHLEGKSVTVVGDGALDGVKTVTGGAITLGGSYSHVIVGIPYNAYWRTMKIEPLINGGQTARRNRKSINRITVKCHESQRIFAGVNDADLQPMQAPPEYYGVPTPLITGNQTIDLTSGNLDAVSVLVASLDPFPATIIAIYPDVTIEA